MDKLVKIFREAHGDRSPSLIAVMVMTCALPTRLHASAVTDAACAKAPPPRAARDTDPAAQEPAEVTRPNPPDPSEDLSKRLLRKAVSESDPDVMETILNLMDSSAKKVSVEFDAGSQTQAVQETILQKLDEAIKIAALRRKISRQNVATSGLDRRRMPSVGQRKAEGGQEPGGHAREGDAASSASGGDQDSPTTQSRDDAGDLQDIRRGWGHLPTRERDEFIQGIGEEYLDRYRVWVERYYRALQESEP